MNDDDIRDFDALLFDLARLAEISEAANARAQSSAQSTLATVRLLEKGAAGMNERAKKLQDSLQRITGYGNIATPSAGCLDNPSKSSAGCLPEDEQPDLSDLYSLRTKGKQ